MIDYALLPYHRFGASKYGFLGQVYALADFQPPTPDTVARLQAIIDEAFGRSGTPAPAEPGGTTRAALANEPQGHPS